MFKWFCGDKEDAFDHARQIFDASLHALKSTGPFCVIDMVSVEKASWFSFSCLLFPFMPIQFVLFAFQLIPLGLLCLWYGVSLSARPLHNKGTGDIAAIAHRAQMQLLLFCTAGAMLAVGALHWVGRV